MGRNTIRPAVLVAILSLIFLVAGCTDTADEQSSIETYSGDYVTGATEPRGNGTDYHVDETFTVTDTADGTLDQEWTWPVDSAAHDRFVVRVEVTGPNEAPQLLAHGLTITLIGSLDAGGGVRQAWGGDGATNFMPSDAVVDFDGAGGDTVGDWSLNVRGGQGAYEVHVLVDLAY